MAETQTTTAQPSLQRFIAQIKTKSLARPTRYWFRLTEIPEVMQNEGSNALENLSVYCKSVSIPDQTIATDTATFPSYTEPMPKGKTYGTFSASFYVSNGMAEYKYFEKWMNAIFNRGTARVTYKNKIIGRCTVEQLDMEGRCQSLWTFYDIFPTTISSLKFDYSSANQNMNVDVTFGYSYFELTTNSTLSVPESVSKTTKSATETTSSDQGTSAQNGNEVTK